VLKPAALATQIAVTCAAYLAADFAHEGLGHIGACLALGGKPILLSTTYAECSITARIIDGSGPVAGLITAVAAWLWLRFAPPRAPTLRSFLFLLIAFTAFWNLGYMIKSGVLNQGDWAFVIRGLDPPGTWHVGLALLGLVLYIATIRLCATMLYSRLRTGGSLNALGFTLNAYGAAAVLSAAGAAFDPRGPFTILTDALPSSLGAIGVDLAGHGLTRREPEARVTVPPSPTWIAIGVVSSVVFIAILGPGLRL